MNLVLQRFSLPALTLAPEAAEARGKMLRHSQMIQTVGDNHEQAVAVAMGVELQKHIREVEETRLELARPLTEKAKQLRQIEIDYLAPLLVEKERLGRLVTARQQAEAHRVVEEERKRREEIEALEKARAEAEAKAQRARTEAGQLKAELAAHQAQQAQEEIIRAPLPAAVKAAGAATRKKLCWRVTDIKALYAARPELCTIEAKASAIQAVCKATDKIDGLELWDEPVTSFRRQP